MSGAPVKGEKGLTIEPEKSRNTIVTDMTKGSEDLAGFAALLQNKLAERVCFQGHIAAGNDGDVADTLYHNLRILWKREVLQFDAVTDDSAIRLECYWIELCRYWMMN